MKDGHTTPLWKPEGTGYPGLQQDLEADVCIIGGGIAGITTAYEVSRQGRTAVILDQSQPGNGETGRTTAHLSNALDDRYERLESVRGKEIAALAAESHTAAIHYIEEAVRRESISCGFRRCEGRLFCPDGGDRSLLEKEFEAARRAGLQRVWWEEGLPFEHLGKAPCLVFPDQGEFHPLLYIDGLMQAVRRAGGLIFGGTHVKAVEDGPAPLVYTENGRTVQCRALVIATNTPINLRVDVHVKQAAYRTYAIAAEMPRPGNPGLFWDTLDPYHYVRFADTEEAQVIILGGEDHKTGQGSGEEAFAKLAAWLDRHVPQAGPILYRWSGQVNETPDGLGFIGRSPGAKGRIFVATGDSGMGMTHGTIAGMLLADLIQDRENAWARAYDPSRLGITDTPTLASENANVLIQYADWIPTAPAADHAQLAPGEGAVFQDGLRKVAVCRDLDGALHRCSAVCPHLGAIVRWNATEHTWDCPAHGSRYEPDGQVIHGPAKESLTPIGGASKMAVK